MRASTLFAIAISLGLASPALADPSISRRPVDLV
jgi:hypothetical protein